MEIKYEKTAIKSEGNSCIKENVIEKKGQNKVKNLTDNNILEPNNNLNSNESNNNSQSNTGAIIMKENSKMDIPNIQNNNDNNEITIEKILENDDYMNDLKSNPHSRFIEQITSDNIKKLIEWCLLPPSPGSELSKNQIKYSYYSCQILCSSLVLLFSKSIENIKKANQAKDKQTKDKTTINSNSNTSSNKNSNGNLESISQQLDNNLRNETQEENNFDDFFKFSQDFDKEDKFPDNTETEIRKEKVSKRERSGYSEEEKKIINEILDYIFIQLDFIKKEDQTYMGYFQKIINYVLLNEFEHIFYYLFEKKANNALNKLYKHLDNSAIQIIMENLLNILSDNQDKEKHQNLHIYNKIIEDIIKELKNDENYEKSESICELIISTLINNSEKQLIQLVFQKKKI